MKLYQQDELIIETDDKVDIVREMLTYDNNQYRVTKDGQPVDLTSDLEDFEVAFSLRGGGGSVPFTRPVWFADIDQLFDAAMADNKRDFWWDE